MLSRRQPPECLPDVCAHPTLVDEIDSEVGGPRCAVAPRTIVVSEPISGMWSLFSAYSSNRLRQAPRRFRRVARVHGRRAIAVEEDAQMTRRVRHTRPCLDQDRAGGPRLWEQAKIPRWDQAIAAVWRRWRGHVARSSCDTAECVVEAAVDWRDAW